MATVTITVTHEVPEEAIPILVAGFAAELGPKSDPNMSDIDYITSTMKDKFKEIVKAGLIKIAMKNAAAAVVLPSF